MSVSTKKKPAPRFATVADLLKRLGDVPAERVRLDPHPGTAKERDVIAARERDGVLCELVDGVLVEKPMGSEESNWTAFLIWHLMNVVVRDDLGKVYAPDGPVRLAPGLVRYPDVAFTSWERLPKSAPTPITEVVPDLAAEILSKSNTKKEMTRKVDEYFGAGVRLVWLVDPRKREVRVYNSPAAPVVLTADDVLDGGDVVPGFRLALAEWFAQAESRGPKGRR